MPPVQLLGPRPTILSMNCSVSRVNIPRAPTPHSGKGVKTWSPRLKESGGGGGIDPTPKKGELSKETAPDAVVSRRK